MAGVRVEDLGKSKPISTAAKCLVCSKPTGRSLTPLACNICNRECHKKCSGLPRKEMEVLIEAKAWKCKRCTPKIKPTVPGPSTINPQPAEEKAAFLSRGRLRILQWNADGVGTKIPELERCVVEYDIDVVVLQESKLMEKNSTPQLSGFTAVRRDRGARDGSAERRGGGLLTYVKTDIPYTVVDLPDASVGSLLERLTVEVRAGSEGRLRITNVYCPPTRGEASGAEFSTNGLPGSKRNIILGDLNAHSPLWDREQPGDQRGEAVEEWLMCQDFAVVNDGTATRVNRGTGGGSAPDVSLVHHSHLDKIEWSCLECMGSDHLPILIEWECRVESLKAVDPGLRWKWSKADWPGYTAAMELKVSDASELLEAWDMEMKHAYLTSAMLSAAKTHIGQAKASSTGKPWMTDEIRQAVKHRNKLRSTVSANREEWILACREVQELVRKSKEERWRDFLGDGAAGPNPSKMWETVKKLSGSQGGAARNEILRHNGREIAAPVAKADAFMKQYAAVSRLQIHDRTERMRKKILQRKLAADSADPESCSPFTPKELADALAQMRTKSAAGPDDIPPRFLKELGPLASNLLLDIANLSWETGFCPQPWRDAEIIPLLKKGKPASSVDSYRPVSLTSCIAKTVERMVASRMAHLAEQNQWWCEDQAGFRRLRSCEDQVLRITQTISDGFQEKPSKRGVLVLLDYSKAYDTVWREELMLGMVNKGVPIRMVRWVMAFLRNRQARVRLDGQVGHAWKMKQGLPQGAVLSPLLFLFYIDSVREAVPKGVQVSMYADDLALYALHHRKEEAQAAVQAAVDAVEQWSRSKKLKLNTAKCEVTFFSNDPGEAGWKPTITLLNTTLAFNKTPTFLGVMFDRTLSFGPQVEVLRKKVGAKCNLLAMVASREWGWSRESLKQVFQATVCSVLNYCGPAWQPWLSVTNVRTLDACQNRALRMVTGQLQSTPLEALRLEAEVPSMQTMIRRNCANAWEKTLRLPATNPRSKLVEGPKHRVKGRSSWREMARREEVELGWEDQTRAPFPQPKPPWGGEPVRRWIALTDTRPSAAACPTEEKRREAAVAHIEAIGPFEWSIYTDGTPGGIGEDSGAAAVICGGPPDSIVRKAVRRRRGGGNVSAFEAELDGLRLALSWLKSVGPRVQGRVLIATDCKALVSELAYPSIQGDGGVEELRDLLDELPQSIVVQWVPGHCGLVGNEWADGEARVATTGRREEEEENRGVPLCTAKARIRRLIFDPPTEHARTRAVYQGTRGKAVLTRKEAVLLAQLRSGHCRRLAGYRSVMEEGVSPTCPNCGGPPESVEHWLRECPASAERRESAFGTTVPDMSVLYRDPVAVLAYVRDLWVV